MQIDQHRTGERNVHGLAIGLICLALVSVAAVAPASAAKADLVPTILLQDSRVSTWHAGHAGRHPPGLCVAEPGLPQLSKGFVGARHLPDGGSDYVSVLERPASSSDGNATLILLTASLVGVGGIPLAWGLRRDRRAPAGPGTRQASQPYRNRRILVIGTGERALEVMHALAKWKCPVEVVGCYPTQQDGEARVARHLLLSADKSLTETARDLGVDEIVVAVAQRRGGVLPMRELLDCRLYGIIVRDLASHFEHWLGQIRLDSLKAGWLIFGGGFCQSVVRSAIKSLFDAVCSGILLILTLPVMLLTAIAIVVESGFPIFYRQERVGLNGKVFNVIKFRSMRTDAEKDGRPRWAQVGDSRVTRVGKIIRKLRIDELPQLFSVFNGDMSLVGPRPERPFFVEKLTREIPFYAVRHSIKPGVTGWAQVRYHYGASVEDAMEKLQYDLYYVKNHSLFLDLKVLFGTVSVVLLAKGA